MFERHVGGGRRIVEASVRVLLDYHRRGFRPALGYCLIGHYAVAPQLPNAVNARLLRTGHISADTAVRQDRVCACESSDREAIGYSGLMASENDETPAVRVPISTSWPGDISTFGKASLPVSPPTRRSPSRSPACSRPRTPRLRLRCRPSKEHLMSPNPLPPRLGPRPLPLHLGTALMTWASSESAWRHWKPGSPTSKASSPVPEAISALLPEIAALEARDGAGKFERRFSREIGAAHAPAGRRRARLSQHPVHRTLENPAAVWSEGNTRLLDYGATHRAARAAAHARGAGRAVADQSLGGARPHRREEPAARHGGARPAALPRRLGHARRRGAAVRHSRPTSRGSSARSPSSPGARAARRR